jgi:uncharacterized membrane protein
LSSADAMPQAQMRPAIASKTNCSARDLAGAAVESGSALPSEYYRIMGLWFGLGWPAFLGTMAIFWLMVAKPDL